MANVTNNVIAIDEKTGLCLEGSYKKRKLYHAFGDYISTLEDMLDASFSLDEKTMIRKEIKKLKTEQKKYYVPSSSISESFEEDFAMIKRRRA